jgi:hypothetical protein
LSAAATWVGEYPALAATADGGAIVAGSDQKDGFGLRVSADGKVVWQAVWADFPIRAVAVNTDGTLWLGNQAQNADAAIGLANSSGKITKTITFSKEYGVAELFAPGDGTVIAATGAASLHKLAADGTALWVLAGLSVSPAQISSSATGYLVVGTENYTMASGATWVSLDGNLQNSATGWQGGTSSIGAWNSVVETTEGLASNGDGKWLLSTYAQTFPGCNQDDCFYGLRFDIMQEGPMGYFPAGAFNYVGPNCHVEAALALKDGRFLAVGAQGGVNTLIWISDKGILLGRQILDSDATEFQLAQAQNGDIWMTQTEYSAKKWITRIRKFAPPPLTCP